MANTRNAHRSTQCDYTKDFALGFPEPFILNNFLSMKLSWCHNIYKFITTRNHILFFMSEIRYIRARYNEGSLYIFVALSRRFYIFKNFDWFFLDFYYHELYKPGLLDALNEAPWMNSMVQITANKENTGDSVSEIETWLTNESIHDNWWQKLLNHEFFLTLTCKPWCAQAYWRVGGGEKVSGSSPLSL
jgi:hypothetical protein